MKTKLALAAATLIFAAGYTALGVTALAAQAATKPSVTYSEQGTCHNGSGASGACSTHITITSNPSNVGVAAWQQCGTNALQYGGWHYNAGTVSNTANCASGFVTSAGFEYPKSNPGLVYWYFPGNSRTGSC